MMFSLQSYRVFLTAAIIVASASCAGSHSSQDVDKNSSEIRKITPPLVAYCSNINYDDTTKLQSRRGMEKIVGQIVRMMATSDSAATDAGLTIFFNGLRHNAKVLSLATSCADKYLNNLASPARDEEKYIKLLSTLLAVDSLPDYERELASERLRIASLNRRGTIANDFSLELADGSRHTLHGIKSPLTLMVFYDPECSHCSDILVDITNNQTVNSAIGDGDVTVVAVYTEGKYDVWRNNLDKMPSNWIVGYDRSAVLDNDLYDIPAMPTLYLLDSNKRVLLKDPDHRTLSKALRNEGVRRGKSEYK